MRAVRFGHGVGCDLAGENSARSLNSRSSMSNAWSHAVVVDPRQLSQLTEEVTRLRGISVRQRAALTVVAAVCVAISAALGLQSLRLSRAAIEARQQANEARQHQRASLRANAALTALARSHEQILAATEQAPSVGTKSWGRRFTVTKYLPLSPKYGKT